MPALPRLLLVPLTLLPLACKVTAKADPETPPRVELKYRIDDGKSWIDVSSGGSITVSPNDTLYLYACATDDEGVSIVTITGNGTKRCAVSGEVSIGPYSFSAETRSSAGVGELTSETLVVVSTIPISGICEGGESGSTLYYTATGLLFNPTFASTAGTLNVTVE